MKKTTIYPPPKGGGGTDPLLGTLKFTLARLLLGAMLLVSVNVAEALQDGYDVFTSPMRYYIWDYGVHKCKACHFVATKAEIIALADYENGQPTVQTKNIYGLEWGAKLTELKAERGGLCNQNYGPLCLRQARDEALTRIEYKDSDGDGFCNVDEISRDYLPGDPLSKPPIGVADIAVRQRLQSFPYFSPGSDITLQIVVSNKSCMPATAVQLTSNLSVPLSVSSVTPSQGSCTIDGRSFSCSLGLIPNDDPNTPSNENQLVITVVASTSFIIRGTGTSNVSVSAAEDDPNTVNNTTNTKVKVYNTHVNTGTLSLIDEEVLGENLNDVAVSPDGAYVYLVSGPPDNKISMFERDPDTGHLNFFNAISYRDGYGADGLEGALSVAVSPDSAHVYVASPDESAIAMFDRYLGYLGKLGGSSTGIADALYRVNDVAVSPDGAHVYATSRATTFVPGIDPTQPLEYAHDGAIALYTRDPATGLLTYVNQWNEALELNYGCGLGNCLFARDGLEGANSVVVTSDGAKVYVGSGDPDDAVAVFIRDQATGDLTYWQRYMDGSSGVDGLDGASDIIVSADLNSVYAAGYWDHAVSIFNTNTYSLDFNQAYTQVYPALSRPQSLAIAPDGANLYLASFDNIFVLDRNLTTGQLVFRQNVESSHSALDFLDGPKSVAISPDGANVYLVSKADQSVYVFERDFVPVDSDSDGLMDFSETNTGIYVNAYNAGTDPNEPDTDGDGLSDGMEVNTYDSNPLISDTDGDGLSDGMEVNTYGSNPTISDTDGDGLSDGVEVDAGLSPTDSTDAALDPDADGLSNSVELGLGTNRLVSDTDGDGLSDGDEINTHGTNPLSADTDGGGRGDGDELQTDGTNPLDSADDVPVVSLPHTLTDGNGFIWDIYGSAPYAGSIINGTSDAYDGGLQLQIDSVSIPAVLEALTEYGGRELALDPVTQSGLTVVRKIFVPTTEAFVRYLEVLSNPTGLPITANVVLYTNLGSDSSTELVATSSGDQTFAVDDDYLVTDDTDSAGDPSMAHVFSGPGAGVLEPSSVTTTAPGGDNITYGFDVTIPAGETVILMHFGSQNADRATATLSADTLRGLGGSALDGLSVEETTQIINFSLDADGDGLTDAEEQLLGTGLNDPDSDSDGLTDGAEVNVYGSNPLVSDTDGSGRTDGQEVLVDGTDPLQAADDLPLVTSFPINLTDGAGFLWDVLGDGRIRNGTNDAYDSGLVLYVDGVSMPFLGTATLQDGNREVGLGPVVLSGLHVARKVYVPEDDGYARFLEILSNTTANSITTTLQLATNLGSDTGTVLVTTSSGDQLFTVNDDYIVTDDVDGAGDPSMAHIFSGTSTGVLEPSSVSTTAPGDDDITYTFDVTVPPGETVVLTHFASQNPDQTKALARAQSLQFPGAAVLSGMSTAERLGVINFLDGDGDGLIDAREISLGTNLTNPDSDGDGLSDGFEVRFGFDPLTGGEAGQDPDGDGLTNLDEQSLGTDPTDADPDGDGLNDYEEVNIHGTDPLVADTDDDGLIDGEEINTHGTNPLSADTDGGGRKDGEEVLVDGTDPLNAADDLLKVALPQELYDLNNFLWDIQGSGYITNGTIDAYDVGLLLQIDGISIPPVSEAAVEEGGRELALDPVIQSGLIVVRKIFVPATEAFVRYLEVLSNPTGSAITANVQLNTNLGSDGSTVLVNTSSGDQVFTIDDDYLVTDDVDGAGDPSMAHVFSGPGANVLAPSSVSTTAPGSDSITYAFDVTVPAGETIILMHFASQNADRATAILSADTLRGLGGAALDGLSIEETTQIVNFNLDSDGDGISDAAETALGTNPNNVDSDNDGLVDGAGGVVPLSALPGGVDSDADGFVDGEQDLGTDPTNSDSDGDGISDGDEVGLYGIDPTVSNVGDVGPRGSLDNLVNLGDLIVLTHLVTGAIQPTTLEMILGDINNDSQLNTADILLLQQSILSGTLP